MSNRTRSLALCRVVVTLLIFGSLTCCSGPRHDEPATVTATQVEHALDAKVMEYLGPLIERHDLSGVVLIGDRERVRLERAFGEAAPGRPNTPATRFALASVTKTFTAGAALIATREGILALEDTVDRFGLDLPGESAITVRHLLSHASGLDNPDYMAAFEERIDLPELVRRIAARPLLFEPGSKHRYSNAGYNVLARVIEAASGESYDAFLASRILGPLGMSSTGHDFGRTGDSLASGHVPAPGPAWREPTPFNDLAFSFGSGSLWSTAPDLLAWARAVAEERLFAWRDLEWPYGWGRVEIGEHKGIEQTGATTGFMSNLLVFPDDGLFVIVLWNQEYGGWVKVGHGLAAVAFGEPHDPIPSLQAIALEDGTLGRYVGRYRSGDDLIEVIDRGGHLWIHSNGWPVGKHLTPLSAAEFAVRSDMGTIRFRGGAGEAFAELYWDFGDSGNTYARE